MKVKLSDLADVSAEDVMPPKRIRLSDIHQPDQFDDALAGMGTGERMLAGIGGAMYGPVLGVKQITGNAGPDDVADYKQAMQALARTGAGGAGQMIGTAAPLTLAAPFRLANTAIGAATIGGAEGALQPAENSTERLQNTIRFAGANAALPAAVGVGRTVGALSAPFTRSGQQRIAGRVLAQNASDPQAAMAAARNPRQIVPGSQPTLAEATLDPGLATLQETMRSVDPVIAKAQLVARSNQQNAARLAQLKGIAGSAEDLEKAVAQRDLVATQLYGKAFSTPIDAAKAEAMQGQISMLMSRPSIKAAIAKAKQIAAEEGVEIGEAGSVKGLHYIKKALDDALDSAQQTGIGNAQKSAITKTREQLLDVIDDLSPDYAQARKVFADMSKPINKMEVGQRLYGKTTKALMEGTESQRFMPDRFASNLADEEALVRQATGFKGSKGLADVMSPDEIAAINAIKDDLQRAARASELAKVQGSPTTQYMVGRDMLSNLAGPLGVPRSFAQSNFVENFLSRPMSILYGVPEREIKAMISKGLLDPEDAARMMQQALLPPSRTARMLENSSRYASPAVAGGLLAD